jgi:hypothetical protein
VTTDEIIEVVTAFKNGSTIETRTKRYRNSEWVALLCPAWNFSGQDYRVKKELYTIEEIVKDIDNFIGKSICFRNCTGWHKIIDATVSGKIVAEVDDYTVVLHSGVFELHKE